MADSATTSSLEPTRERRTADWFRDAWERLAAQRKEIEKTLDEQISRALARVKVPRREEIDALGKRVGRIAERIEALEARRE